MANFAVAASPETIERANKVMDMYAQEGDKKEDTLLRIIALAESDSVKGTHPELAGTLKNVDSTIGILIKQINGIVAGQDNRIADLTNRLNTAIEEKRTALEAAKAQTEAAITKMEAAEAYIKQAESDSELVRTQAQTEIEAVKKDAAIVVERANSERDQAIRERDDARTISEEKTASNDLLMRQMTTMEADAAAYKTLQEEHGKLTADYSSIRSMLADKERELEEAKKEAERAAKAAEKDLKQAQKDAEKDLKQLQTQATADLKAAKADADRVQKELSALQVDFDNLSSENTDLKNQIQALNQNLIRQEGEYGLAVEKAVNAAEKAIRDQLQAEIRQADKENAKLTAQIEQLQAQIAQLTA